MKGIIVQCLANLVTEKFGKDKWEASLEGAGLPKNAMFLASDDVDDQDVLKVVGSVCKVLNISLEQAADAFGMYWVNSFAPNVYKSFYVGVNSAKDFLLKMDDVHRVTTSSMPNARPPRFDYDWKDDKTLIMTYNSPRNLIDFLVGLIKGVGTYYKENLNVKKLGNNRVEIAFV